MVGCIFSLGALGQEIGSSNKMTELHFFVFRQSAPHLACIIAILITYNHNKVADRQVLNPVNQCEAHSSARDSLSLTKAQY